jgi:hypothetical protein
MLAAQTDNQIRMDDAVRTFSHLALHNDAIHELPIRRVVRFQALLQRNQNSGAHALTIPPAAPVTWTDEAPTPPSKYRWFRR